MANRWIETSSSSDLAATQSRDALQASVNRLLENNLELRASLTGAWSTVPDSILAPGSRPVSRAASVRTTTTLLLPKPFENVLYRTRVYSRIRQSSECDRSLHTDLVSTHLGSTYTGITLDRISIISVVALPLPWSSIVNPKWYRQQKLHSVDEMSETSRPSSIGPLEYKIAVVGGPATGKSALVSLFCNGNVDINGDQSDPTIEDRYQKDLSVNGQHIKLEIIDTAGAEEYEHFREPSIEEADGIIITFSVRRATEFDRVEDIHNRLKEIQGSKEPRPIAMVGTCADTENLWPREVSVSQGRALAMGLGCGFFECSAKDGRKIDDPFLFIVKRLMRPLREHSRPSDASGLKLLGWE
jgi:small GTP-binding protein